MNNSLVVLGHQLCGVSPNKLVQPDAPARLDIISSFESGSEIPTVYSSDGANESPPFRWSLPPKTTKELLLLCEDPDAPYEHPMLHWILYNIPKEILSIPQGVENGDSPPSIAPVHQGLNGHSERKYFGPQPLDGDRLHHYYFQLFALSRTLSTRELISRDRLIDALQGNIVGYGEIVATDRRSKASTL